MDSGTVVTLNGVELYEGIDYTWEAGVLRLKRKPPVLTFPSFRENVKKFLTFRWASVGNPNCNYPDFVVVENWEYGVRDTYVSGTEEFNERIKYESP